MAAITPTKNYLGEFGGQTRILNITVTPGSASDTVDLSTLGINSVVGIIGATITAGADANLLTIHPSVSSLTLTLVTKGADGLAATDWTGASANVTLLVS